LANMEILASPRMRRYINRQAETFNETEKVLFSEIVFLLKTFFFIYIGISIQLSDLRPLLIGLGITTVLFFLRIPVVRFSMPKDQTDKRDMYYMSAIFPKGLAAAVLATIPLQRGIAGGEFIMNVTFSIVLFSITFTSFLIPMIDKVPAIRKFYDVSFIFYGWFNDLLRKTDSKDELHLISNNSGDELDQEQNSSSDTESEKTELKKDK